MSHELIYQHIWNDEVLGEHYGNTYDNPPSKDAKGITQKTAEEG